MLRGYEIGWIGGERQAGRSRPLFVPFRYEDRSRPACLGPYPRNLTKTPSIPKTLFIFTLRSRRRNTRDIEVHLFLPSSRVCTVKEPIPFFLTLRGDEESLTPFATYQPTSSIHPLHGSTSPIGSIKQHIRKRSGSSAASSSPVMVQLQRRSTVDAIAAGMPIDEEKGHMTSMKMIGQGVIQGSNRGPSSITWSGMIVVPPKITSVGFTASGLKVLDCVVVSITPPDAASSHYMTFSESIPMRLTTEPHDCYSPNVSMLSDWE